MGARHREIDSRCGQEDGVMLDPKGSEDLSEIQDLISHQPETKSPWLLSANARANPRREF